MNMHTKQILSNALAAAALLTAMGCTADDTATSEPTAAGEPLAVTVSDRGFKGTSGTRAVESGYTTKFTAGDQIGVFAVRQGESKVNALVDNVCLTAADNGYETLTWKDTNGNSLVSLPGATYYAYYPYAAGTTIDATKQTADEAFATLISGWQPQADQSAYESYTKSDLMVASATPGNGTLTFSMAHKMALVVIDMPKTVYKFSDTSLADYTVSSTIDWSLSSNTPCYFAAEGVYRFIINPSSSASKFTGTYNQGNNLFSLTATTEEGKYGKYAVDGATVTTISGYKLQVGDFLLSDGSLLSKSADAKTISQADIIGIVFQTTPSRIGELEKGKGYNHGLVLATKFASDEVTNWGKDGTDEDDRFLPNTRTWKAQYNNVNGYKDTQYLIETYNATLQSDYPVFYAVKQYRQNNPTPDCTTEWFLPSIGQWWDVLINLGGVSSLNNITSDETIRCDYNKNSAATSGHVADNTRAKINAYFNNVESTELFNSQFSAYWSSSEECKDHACVFRFGSKGRIYLDSESKEIKWPVRCILAF